MEVVRRLDGNDNQFLPCPFEREVQVRRKGGLIFNLHRLPVPRKMICWPAEPGLPIGQRRFWSGNRLRYRNPTMPGLILHPRLGRPVECPSRQTQQQPLVL